MDLEYTMPRFRELVRHALPKVLEGTILPVGIFLVALDVLGVWGAIFAGLGWCYTAIAWRLVIRRGIPGLLVIGAVMITARSALALATGSTFVYFLQPTFGNALVAVAFLVSIPTSRPLAGRLANDICPIPAEVIHNERMRGVFVRISLLWAGASILNAALTLWLLLTQSVGVYVLSRTAVSLSITVTAIVLSVLWFRRSLPSPEVATSTIAA